MENFKLIVLLILAVLGLTSCVKSPQFSFGLAADIQYADREPTDEADYRASLQKCTDMAEQFNSEELAFAVQLGDIIDCQYASYDSLLPIWNTVDVNKYNVLGNHDYVPDEVSREQILQRLLLERDYYDFNYDNWRFIVLNSSDVSLHANEPGSAKYIIAEKMLARLKAEKADGAHPWNGAVGKDQLQWLNSKLKSAQESGENVIILSHHPVIPSALWNSGEVLDVLEQYSCVFAFISGHLHGGSFTEKNGINHWVVKSMLSKTQQTSYAIADVYVDRIEIRGMGREADMKLMLGERHKVKQK